MVDVIINFVGNDRTGTITILIGVVFMIFLFELGRQIGWRIFGISIIPLEIRKYQKNNVTVFRISA